MSRWFPLSGGLLYHLKALRYRDSYWRGFRDHLERLQLEWLQGISSSQRENLVLIGGSGGHCQSQIFLKSFKNIIHVDIDSCSPFFFKRNHPELKVQFIRQNAFTSEHHVDDALLERFPATTSTWMWCNLLGQIGFHYTEYETHKVLENISLQMRDHAWMSFHDLYSFHSRTKHSGLKLSPHFNKWEEARIELSQLKQERIDLTDHQTKDVFDFERREILLWPLTPKQIHFIECGFTCA